MATQRPVQVLVIEDDPSVQQLLSDALAKQGFEVAVERDGRTGLRAFMTRPPQAVILDVLLPWASGYEVARRIRSSGKGQNVPIILLSGMHRDERQRAAAFERYGVAAFLEKPIKLQLLFDALRNALGDRYPGAEPPSSPPIRRAPVAADEIEAPLPPPSLNRGDFAKKSFPQLLGEIDRWKGDGALLLRRGAVKKIVYFQNGQPCCVKSNLIRECLGRVMVRAHLIPVTLCDATLAQMTVTGKRQGELLLEMGAIDPEVLARALALQLKTKLFEVFAWRTGQFQFDPGARPPPHAVIDAGQSTLSMIYEGVRRTYGPARLRAALGEVDGSIVVRSESAAFSRDGLDLPPAARRFLHAIDGRCTVRDLRAIGILSPVDTERLLFALGCAQRIELIAPAGSELPPPSPSDGPPVADLPSSEIELADSDEFSSLDALPWHQAVEPQPQPRKDLAAPGPRRMALPELPPREAERYQALWARLAAMEKMDHFEVLGLTRDARPEEISQAYLKLARENHPDAVYQDASPSVRQLAARIYDLITQAHNVLAFPEEKLRYLDELTDLSRQAGNGQDLGNFLAAEDRFQKGEELLRQGRYAEAHQAFLEAVNLHWEEGEFHAELGWSRFQMEPKSPLAAAEALQALENAVQLNPKSPRGYLLSGYVYRALGQDELADRQFEKAISVNPGSAEAIRGLMESGAVPGPKR